VDEKNLKIGIIGAGIQGVCNALFLQKKGFHVTLFDREEPGSAASYGNAGHFSPYASVPLNRPDVIADVPSMLISSRGPLALKWNYVPKMIPWFARFILNCREEKMMHTAKNMHQILDQSLPAFDELFDEIDLEGLVENNGILYVWTDQNMKSRELEIRIRDQLGVKQQLVNKKEIHDLEPNLKPFYHGGVFYDYARHARNPRKILIKLFENFVHKGGRFLKLNIQDIDFDEEKPVLRTESQRFIFDKLVIACGAFSKRLTDKLHENIPLDTERGYHVHFKDYDHLISRPMFMQIEF
jgi:Glycine/D-amino acid oxidases (deaminating)